MLRMCMPIPVAVSLRISLHHTTLPLLGSGGDLPAPRRKASSYAIDTVCHIAKWHAIEAWRGQYRIDGSTPTIRISKAWGAKPNASLPSRRLPASSGFPTRRPDRPESAGTANPKIDTAQQYHGRHCYSQTGDGQRPTKFAVTPFRMILYPYAHSLGARESCAPASQERAPTCRPWIL